MTDIKSLIGVERVVFIEFVRFCANNHRVGMNKKEIVGWDIPISPFLREPAILALQSHGILDIDSNGFETWWTLDPSVANEAFEMAESLGLIARYNSGIAPASDRFVHRDDNMPEVVEAADDASRALDELATAVETANEFTVTSDDRLAVVREIRDFSDALRQPSIRASRLWGAIQSSSTLVWLKNEVASGTIRALATQAVVTILKLLGFA
jgi:hypothetical protein